MDNEIIRYILALTKIKGVGSVFIKKRLPIFQKYQNNIQEFKIAFHKSLSKKEKEKIDIEYYLDEIDELLNECKMANIAVIDISNTLYPQNLLELTDPPAILYAKGNLALLEKKIIGIIGTRKATTLGKDIASKVGLFYSQEFAIINGLVEGIDSSALINKDSVHLNIIGILSGGLNFNSTSSKTTQDLAKKVLNNKGLLLSESYPNQKEDAFSGSKSSRIQAGLSDALILIQSSIDGGSKYTLNSFKGLVRPLAVISFLGHTEFKTSDAFGANRLLLEKKTLGLSFICERINNKDLNLNECRKITKVKVSKIIEIKNKEDYFRLIKFIHQKNILF